MIHKSVFVSMLINRTRCKMLWKNFSKVSKEGKWQDLPLETMQRLFFFCTVTFFTTSLCLFFFWRLKILHLSACVCMYVCEWLNCLGNLGVERAELLLPGVWTFWYLERKGSSCRYGTEVQSPFSIKRAVWGAINVLN